MNDFKVRELEQDLQKDFTKGMWKITKNSTEQQLQTKDMQESIKHKFMFPNICSTVLLLCAASLQAMGDHDFPKFPIRYGLKTPPVPFPLSIHFKLVR